MSYIVYLQKPSNWSNAYCYAYSSTDATLNNAACNGVAMTSLGSGLYSCTLPDSLGANPFVVFNDGVSLQYPSSGGLATTSYQMLLSGTTWSVYNSSTSTVSTSTVTDNYYTGTNGLLVVNNVFLFAIIVLILIHFSLGNFFKK